jgi:tetratricopeptide (TPR) repeat protein
VAKRTAFESPKPGPEAPASPRNWLDSYCLALVFFALGSLSKPTVVTLPLILLLLDYWPLNRVPATGPGGARNAWRKWFPLLWEKIPFFLVSAAGCAAAMMTQKNVMLAGQHQGLYWRFGNVLFAYADYLWHTVYPAGLALVYPYSSANPPIITVVWSGLVLLIISIGALQARRRHPYLLVGWLWYLGMLLPVIDTMQATQNCRADRYTYLPQIGICILVTWGATELLKRWRHRALALGVAAAIILPALLGDTYIQTRYWQDSATIWTRALACTTSNSFAENCLGSALSNQERWNEAVPHFERAIRIKPDFIDARVNLGITLDNLGKLDEAIQQFGQALQWNPNAADACYNLGSTLAEEGKTAEAIPYLSRAVQLKPAFAKAHYDLGLALASQGKWADAIPHYEQALGAKLDQTSAQYVTGVAMAGRKQWDKAIALYEQALQAKPDFAEAHYRLGMALSARGEPAAAAEHFQKALALATAQGNAGLVQSVRAQLGPNAPALPPH